MKIFLFSFFSFFLFGTWGDNVGTSSNNELIQQDSFPAVCMIGEHEAAIDKLSMEHELLLLSVCEDDMQVAFEKWMSMLQEMEIYAKNIKYDIKGLKLWMNVYWNEDGSVRQISFFPKPRSRNVDPKEIAAFLKGFMKHYRFPLTSEVKFAHYGMATFPTFSNGGLKVER